MFVAVLLFVAHSWAFVAQKFFELFRWQEAFSFLEGVFDLVARELLVLFAATAFEFGLHLARGAFTIVANRMTLVLTAGQESVTSCLASGNRLCALLPLSPNQLLNRLMPTRTKLHPLRIIRTIPTLSRMALTLAIMEPTLQCLPTPLPTIVLRSPTQHFSRVLSTIALHQLQLTARVTRAIMALSGALVNSAVECAHAKLPAREFSSFAYVAWDTLGYFLAIALDWHINITRWTSTWVTQNFTRIMRTILIFLLFTILTTRVWQD